MYKECRAGIIQEREKDLLDYIGVAFKTDFPPILLEGFLRYFVPALLIYGIFWGILAPKMKGRLIQGDWPRRWYAFREFGLSLGTVLIIALVGFAVNFNGTGIFKIYGAVAPYGRPYMVFSFILILLTHDAYFYWTHRLMHYGRIYRIFHSAHHVSMNPSPWAAYSFHPLESTVHALFLPLYLLILPTHIAVVYLFLYHMILRNIWHHVGMEFFPRGFTKHPFWGWIATTTHHSLHHQWIRSNYGFYFTFWDRMMGTLDVDYHEVYEKAASPKEKNGSKRAIGPEDPGRLEAKRSS